MNITLGSTSEDKYTILVDCLDKLKIKYSKITQKSVNSDISEQPLSKEETIIGAINRAKNAYKITNDKNNLIAIGLEGGLEKKNGYYNLFCATAIYDGNNIYIGTSDLIPLPREVSAHIQNNHKFGIKIREYAQNCNPNQYKVEKIDELMSRKKSFKQALNKSFKSLIKETE